MKSAPCLWVTLPACVVGAGEEREEPDPQMEMEAWGYWGVRWAGGQGHRNADDKDNPP